MEKKNNNANTSYWELRNLAEDRMTDGVCLYRQERYNGALYLCGYSVELALKARICKLHEWDSYPPRGKLKQIHITHDLHELLSLAGLEKNLEIAPQYIKLSWEDMKSWGPGLRYISKKKQQPEAGHFFSSSLSVFKWIKKYW